MENQKLAASLLKQTIERATFMIDLLATAVVEQGGDGNVYRNNLTHAMCKCVQGAL